MTDLIDQQTEAWTRYVDARRKADQTLKMADGIAAAKAWHAFLDIFLEEDRTPLAHRSNVINIPRRKAQ